VSTLSTAVYTLFLHSCVYSLSRAKRAKREKQEYNDAQA
jgi:hypothetical protein